MADGFEEFVLSASPRLVRTARLLLGNPSEAEDMAQETLIVQHQHWQRLRDLGAADAYAYKTLVRRTRRHLQRARFRHETTTPPDAMPPSAPAVDAHSDDGGLATALVGLPARQREALVLRYYLDLSIQETAQVMGCGTGTVKSQTSKALSVLRNTVGLRPRLESTDEH